MPVNLSGTRIGRWTVIERVPNVGAYVAWLCRCDCGTEKVVSRASLRGGHSSSCGCYRSEFISNRQRTHGQTNTPTWKSWQSMMTRCYNRNAKGYKYWGGRGITICDRWHTFENFLADMGPRPAGTTIDRIDPDGHYAPGNCRWATSLQQGESKNGLRFIEWNGERKTVRAWAEELGLPRELLWQRIYRGKMTLDEAMTTPPVSRTDRGKMGVIAKHAAMARA